MSTPSFLKAAVAAFPPDSEALATGATNALFPFVDDSYRLSFVRAVVLGREVQIPKRIHFRGLPVEKLKVQSILGFRRESTFEAQCLITRSTDGFQRQAALRNILNLNQPWSIPFVVLLAGEYVVEIIHDIVGSISMLDREAYMNFVRENRGLMRLLRSRAIGYWDRYYRTSYPDRSTYPGLVFLHQLELWAG
jgi:hypothetical protein